MKILLVEDSPIDMAMLVKMYGEAGEVVQASTLKQALAALDDSTLRHIILDLSLPDGSGVRVLEAVRDHRLPVTVCVMSSAEGDDQVHLMEILPSVKILPKPYEVAHWNYLRSTR